MPKKAYLGSYFSSEELKEKYRTYQQDLRKDTNCSINIGSGLSKIHHI